MQMPSFNEYLNTISEESIRNIETRMERNLSFITPHIGGVEDTIVALSTAISLEFLAHYHHWLCGELIEPAHLAPATIRTDSTKQEDTNGQK